MPGTPCRTYEPLCTVKSPGDAKPEIVGAREAIARSAGLKSLLEVMAFDFTPFIKGKQKCVLECMPKADGTPLYPHRLADTPAGAHTYTCSETPPPDDPIVDPIDADTGKPPLGIPIRTWALAGAGLVAALAAGGLAVYLSRRKFTSNASETVGLAEQYLPRSPEAALMIMPPAIPSYLAYRYAVKRMQPEYQQMAEQWRDYTPLGPQSEDSYDDFDDFDDFDSYGW